MTALTLSVWGQLSLCPGPAALVSVGRPSAATLATLALASGALASGPPRVRRGYQRLLMMWMACWRVDVHSESLGSFSIKTCEGPGAGVTHDGAAPS